MTCQVRGTLRARARRDPCSAPGVPSPRFVDVFASHFPWVRRRMLRLGVREAEASDLAQEVFVVVHAQLARYDSARPIRPWLWGIAYRIANRWRALARHRREHPLDALDERTGLALAADGCIEEREARALVRLAFATVAASQRDLLMMHVVDERPMPEIAVHLGIPLNTAYSRMRLARADLAKAVGRLSAPPRAASSRSMAAR